MLIDIFLWIMEVKNMGRRFVIGFHIILIPASTQGLGISAFVDAILIIINDGKTNNLLPYNNIISAIISALIIAYLFRKKYEKNFHNSVRLHTLQSIIDSRAEKTLRVCFFYRRRAAYPLLMANCAIPCVLAAAFLIPCRWRHGGRNGR